MPTLEMWPGSTSYAFACWMRVESYREANAEPRILRYTQLLFSTVQYLSQGLIHSILVLCVREEIGRASCRERV